MFYNIRSIPKHYDNFKLNVLNRVLPKLDILGFCETRLSEDIEELYCPDGYTLHTNNISRKMGGVALLSKTSLNCNVIRDISILKPHLESLFVEYRSKGVRYVCGVMYHRPGTNNDAFMADLSALLANPIIRNSKCCIMGDINFDLFCYDSKPIISDYANSFFNYNFFSVDHQSHESISHNGHTY